MNEEMLYEEMISLLQGNTIDFLELSDGTTLKIYLSKETIKELKKWKQEMQ